MDRQMVWPGAIPLETDILNTNRNVFVALGKALGAILGSSTLLNGLPCTATSPPSLAVLIGAGEIYSLQNVDATPFSSLAADTAHQIFKQGLLLDAVTLACPAPVAGGQSVNYLIEVAFSEVDGGSTVLPYYNAANPQQAWSGPNNSGTANFTARQDKCVVQVKAGTPAATGTQTTPAPDAGYVGAYVVTVANGQSTVTSGNIATYGGAPFITETLTSKIGIATGDARYAKSVDVQNGALVKVASAGGPNAWTGALSPVPSGYTDGMAIEATFSATNTTTSPTLNLNTLGTKIIYEPDGQTGLPVGTLGLNMTLIYRVAAGSGAGGWVAQSPVYATSAMTSAGTDAASSITPAALASVLAALVGGEFVYGTNYIKFPGSGGKIIQWGESSGLTAEGTVSVTFPVAFPTACRSVVPGTHIPGGGTGSAQDNVAQLLSFTTTGATFTIDNCQAVTMTPTSAVYVAFGD